MTQTNNKFNVLVLFSGTKSFSKAIKEIDTELDIECRGVDFDPFFEPYYCVDILTWDYINTRVLIPRGTCDACSKSHCNYFLIFH